jgi:hypothetical protein
LLLVAFGFALPLDLVAISIYSKGRDTGGRARGS